MFKRRRRGASPRVALEPGRWKVVWGPRLRWLGVTVVLASLGTGLYEAGQWLLDPAHFPLRQVRIQGELRNLSQPELQESAKNYLGQSFFALNIDNLQAAFAANPWIDTVDVRRHWPDAVEVAIRERTAFGYWGKDEMVDINGVRFRPNNVRQPGPWPHLIGPDGHESNLIQTWKAVDNSLTKAGVKLVRLVLDQRRAWSMQFANGVEISLGREDFAQRLQRFIDIYPRVLAAQSDRIAVIDMRYTNGFAVRWTAPPEPDVKRSSSSGGASNQGAYPQVVIVTNSSG